MTLEIWLTIGGLVLLFIITLLLLTVVKGIADMLEQRKEIFNKQSEWMNDVYDWIYKTNDDENDVIINDDESQHHNDMFADGLKQFDKKLK